MATTVVEMPERTGNGELRVAVVPGGGLAEGVAERARPRRLHHRDPPVPLPDEPGDPGAGATPVVEQHGVGEKPAGRPVEEDHRQTHLHLDPQV